MQTYKMPEWIDQHKNDPDFVGNLGAFLIENTGSVFGSWAGKMPAKDQRKLFGRFLGKGRVYISGSGERIEHHVKVCFGLDSDMTERLYWRDL